MLTTSGGGRSMLTVADRGEGGKICQNIADVICERSLCPSIFIVLMGKKVRRPYLKKM